MRKKIVRLIALILLLTPAGESGICAGAEPEATQGTAAKPMLKLSLRQAVGIALSPEGNARVQLAEEMIRQARSRSAQARAALLPNVDSAVSQQSQTRNLAAVGIQISFPVIGFTVPTFLGPFNVFDARAAATQTLFDLSSIRRFQASRAGISQAEAEKESARDQTRDLVARAYLAALRAQASLEAVQSNIQLSEALLKVADDQKNAGTGTGIEVTRARVQLANERQRLLVARNELRSANLQLLKAVGLDLDVQIELTDRLSLLPVEPITPERALEIALGSRADWKGQQKRQETTRLNSDAIKMERLPSVVLFGDYGSSGSSINHNFPTRTYGFQVRIPIFDGGRRDARRTEAYSLVRQEVIREKDLRRQIELEIRTALDSLGSADEQVKTAEEGLTLSQNELAQAQRRYKAGMGSGIEVTDAQNRLERARDNRVAALFNHSLARIELSSATGTIRQVTE
jgi:outer membrane protein TolC